MSAKPKESPVHQSTAEKRKNSDDEDDDDNDDRLEDEDYDLLEENLGVKVPRRKFKRVRRIEDDDSDEEITHGKGDKEEIANQLFEGSDNEEDRSLPAVSREEPSRKTVYDSEESDGDYSETDDFIVDDDGRPISDRRKKVNAALSDSKLQDAQDIFGIDFNLDDFDKYGDEHYVDEDEQEEDEADGEQQITRHHLSKKPKSIYEIYEPSELERAGFTDEDAIIRNRDIPERMQTRDVPVTNATEEELEEESEWIYKLAFSDRDKGSEKALPPPTIDPIGDNGNDDDWNTGFSEKPPEQARQEPQDNDDDDWDAPSVNKNKQSSNEQQNAKDNEDDDWDTPSVNKNKQSNNDQQKAKDNEDDDWDTPSTNKQSNNQQQNAKDNDDDDWGDGDDVCKVPEKVIDPKTSKVEKINAALRLIRNDNFEVPFIAFYRQELIEPELTISDLWKIYRLDARFSQLVTRRKRLHTLFANMREYQELKHGKLSLQNSDSMRIITDEDLERIKAIKTQEELKDMHYLFSLYYYEEVPLMKKMLEKNRKNRSQLQNDKDSNEVNPDSLPDDVEAELGDSEEMVIDEAVNTAEVPTAKRKFGGGAYALCHKGGIHGFVKKFGLSSTQFAENLIDNYQRHEVEQSCSDPLDLAANYVSQRIPTPEEVLKAAKFMLATQISREPLVRQSVRELFLRKATINVSPTKKGVNEIDESHPVYRFKYLKEKPVRDLVQDEFLKLKIAQDDKLISMTIGENINGTTSDSYLEEVKSLFTRDEFSSAAIAWNNLRSECLDFAFLDILYPALRKELIAKLVSDAQEHILKICSQKLHHWIKIAPYEPNFGKDDEDWDSSKGLRIVAVAYSTDLLDVSYACYINRKGEPSEHLKLKNLMKYKHSTRESDKIEKEADLLALKNFIRLTKPHVCVIGGESREALTVQEDMKTIITELVEEDGFPEISVEILDNQLATVYANSIKASNDFKEYPPLLRQAVSLGRRMQDPLIEFAQLCTPDDEILCLRFHALQAHVPKEDLLDCLYRELITRTNEVGVDINRAISRPYTANLAQFICGLGRRKSNAIIKILKQNNQPLESRAQLVTHCHMGPLIFVNCSGFIKIDTGSITEGTDTFVEVLDGSRVHPEAYEWAKKMAVDAIDIDDDERNPAGALDEILESPEKLRDLDLDAFADELQRENLGNKSSTLYNIRTELYNLYEDRRMKYVSPNEEELFHMLTKETAETLYLGKIVTATVSGIAHTKPEQQQLENAVPVRDEGTGFWQCCFCLQNDFQDLDDVWHHFDAGICPGKATGVRLRLDNGISAFIPNSHLSDKDVKNPEERVRKGQTVHCRVVKIEIKRFFVECTSRTSDLKDLNLEWRRPRDPFYDQAAEDEAMKKIEEFQKACKRQAYVRRVIVHPCFKNVSFHEAEVHMNQMELGEVIVRPSSKSSDHLTLTWKIADGVHQHIDIREEGKENAFSLGQSLWIDDEEFEDLDEVIARLVNPMASSIRDIMNFKYFKALKSKEEAEEWLKELQRKNANKIHYGLHVSREFPGKFYLSYLPKDKVCHELITVTPDGFRFRRQNFNSLDHLFKWFKDHYRDISTMSTPSCSPRTEFNRNPYITGRLPFPNQYGYRQTLTTPRYSTPLPTQAFTPHLTSFTPNTPNVRTPHIITPTQMVSSVRLPTQQLNVGETAFLYPGTITPRGAEKSRGQMFKGVKVEPGLINSERAKDSLPSTPRTCLSPQSMVESSLGDESS